MASTESGDKEGDRDRTSISVPDHQPIDTSHIMKATIRTRTITGVSAIIILAGYVTATGGYRTLFAALAGIWVVVTGASTVAHLRARRHG
jgi:D-alanyl-D-alanine carboxypeptidase